MRIIADFHIHSKYSRATSKETDLDNLDKWAKIKGIKALGTGDFTHPQWLKEIKDKLEPAEPGLYKRKSEENGTRFILTAEISSIYSKGGKTRRVHNIIFSPSLEAAEKINVQLGWIGNLKSDGRPILGLDCRDLARIVFNVSPDCVLIPAHAWTPWFSVFGSMSGFDSLEDCFEEFSSKIFAIETGLSSDPAMNWRFSRLDKIALISNSDSHSPRRIGREANVFDCELSYRGIIEAIKSRDPEKFLYTVEFFPEEGKYHYDGHRLCKIRFSPEETKKHKGICPACGRKLTMGVMYRVDELADRPNGFKPEKAVPYKSLVPLEEIIGEAFGLGVVSKKVKEEYKNIIEKFGSEFAVLIDTEMSQLKSGTLPEIAEGISRVREGNLKVEPGFDGEYGKVKIFGEKEREELASQKSLF